ncbi:MAG: hypothetical protein H7233_09890 [Pseudorhodobacter sp.]|nr:hypothetical protein [Frankiaceae bacterium]
MSRPTLSVLPAPIALASSYEVARRLDLERRQAQRVAESGLLGPLYRTEGSVLVQADRLDDLAQRRFVDGPHPAALVVRVAPARPDEDDPERDYLGWHAALSEQQRHDATRGWWSDKQPDDVALLLVVICTFVVEVLQVTGYDTGIGAKRRFHTRNAPAGGRPFRDARLRTPPGGSTFLLEERR